MKIKCHRIISPGNGKDITSSSLWLTPNKEYIVLALRIYPDSGVHVALLSDQNYTPIFPSLLGFEIISSTTPPHWITRIDEGGLVEKMPERWFAEDFLDNVDDYVPEAMKIFLEEAELAYDHEGEFLPIEFKGK